MREVKREKRTNLKEATYSCFQGAPTLVFKGHLLLFSRGTYSCFQGAPTLVFKGHLLLFSRGTYSSFQGAPTLVFKGHLLLFSRGTYSCYQGHLLHNLSHQITDQASPLLQTEGTLLGTYSAPTLHLLCTYSLQDSIPNSERS